MIRCALWKINFTYAELSILPGMQQKMAASLLEHFSSVKAKSLLNILIVSAPRGISPSTLNVV
jgi:hypothetical protein